MQCHFSSLSLSKMQRQKSIDSFVSKPSQGNENSGGSSYAEMFIRRWKMQFPTNRVKQTLVDAEVSRVSNQRELPFVETNGTNTPLKKLHARPVNLSVNEKSDSMPFENLMQKFVVEDEPEVVGKGNRFTKEFRNGCKFTKESCIGQIKVNTNFKSIFGLGGRKYKTINSNLCV
ncbi:hypothetical protein AMTRI_Chr02g258740 [Amborella trichopoda]